ncbi:hypothetical protein Dimus_038818 [Dionaea muscipula]
MANPEATSHKTTEDPHDPLILHPSDTPGLKLVNILLDGHNYGEWSRSMRLSLNAMNKLEIVDGTIKAPPSGDPKHHMWQRCNDMILTWILHSIEPHIARSVIFSDTAAAVWSDLKDRFSQGDDTRMYQIRQEIAECRQENQSVSVYYTKLKALWDEIACYLEPIDCTCGASKLLTSREEKEKVMQFLMGLNDSYSTVRGAILMMSPLPDARKAHGMILQHERQMEAANRRENLPTAHAMQTSHPPTRPRTPNQRKPLMCTHCEGEGHTVDRCWYIIGFPVGHKWHGKNMKPRSKRAVSHNVELHKPLDNKGPTFTMEEYNQVMALLKNQHGNDQPIATVTGIAAPTCHLTHHDPHTTLHWIIDSGATDHMSHLPPTHNPLKMSHHFVGWRLAYTYISSQFDICE